MLLVKLFCSVFGIDKSIRQSLLLQVMAAKYKIQNMFGQIRLPLA
jgi:hypothetical protein